jgi:hypothetical protein
MFEVIPGVPYAELPTDIATFQRAHRSAHKTAVPRADGPADQATKHIANGTADA